MLLFDFSSTKDLSDSVWPQYRTRHGNQTHNTAISISRFCNINDDLKHTHFGRRNFETVPFRPVSTEAFECVDPEGKWRWLDLHRWRQDPRELRWLRSTSSRQFQAKQIAPGLWHPRVSEDLTQMHPPFGSTVKQQETRKPGYFPLPFSGSLQWI